MCLACTTTSLYCLRWLWAIIHSILFLVSRFCSLLRIMPNIGIRVVRHLNSCSPSSSQGRSTTSIATEHLLEKFHCTATSFFANVLPLLLAAAPARDFLKLIQPLFWCVFRKKTCCRQKLPFWLHGVVGLFFCIFLEQHDSDRIKIATKVCIFCQNHLRFYDTANYFGRLRYRTALPNKDTASCLVCSLFHQNLHASSGFSCFSLNLSPKAGWPGSIRFWNELCCFAENHYEFGWKELFWSEFCS